MFGYVRSGQESNGHLLHRGLQVAGLGGDVDEWPVMGLAAGTGLREGREFVLKEPLLVCIQGASHGEGKRAAKGERSRGEKKGWEERKRWGKK